MAKVGGTMGWMNLWLTKEQQELLRKVLGAPFASARLPVGPAVVMKYGIRSDFSHTPPPITKYGLPMPTMPGAVRLYFTEQQKSQLRCAGVKPCDFAEIHPTMLMKYGVPLAEPPSVPPPPKVPSPPSHP